MHDHRRGPPTRRLVLTAASFLPFGGASAQTVDAGRRIAEQASRFLASLDDGQRRQVLIAFDAANRLDWHYIPRSRPGLALGEMKPAQAEAARALFATVLSPRGLEMLDGVRLLEGVLREQQGSFRDPGRYYVCIFGTPGRFPWGCRQPAMCRRRRFSSAPTLRWCATARAGASACSVRRRIWRARSWPASTRPGGAPR